MVIGTGGSVIAAADPSALLADALAADDPFAGCAGGAPRPRRRRLRALRRRPAGALHPTPASRWPAADSSNQPRTAAHRRGHATHDLTLEHGALRSLASRRARSPTAGRGSRRSWSRWGFPATVWLLITGAQPTPEQEDALRRVLVAAGDDGLAAPSIAAARDVRLDARGAGGVAMAAGAPLPPRATAAPRAGLAEPLTNEIRERHRCVAGPAADVEAPRRRAPRARRRLPGFGDPYHPRDPPGPDVRAAARRRVPHAVQTVEDVVVAAKGPKLHMNADAAVAGADDGRRAAPVGDRSHDLDRALRRPGGACPRGDHQRGAVPAPSLSSVDYTGPVPVAGGR